MITSGTSPDRYEALRRLLASPDPVDLPPRRNKYICGGDPAMQDRTKREAANAYLGLRMQMYGDDSAVVSVRRTPLRLIRGSLGLKKAANG